MTKAAAYRILRLVAGIAMLAWLIAWVDWRQLAAAVRRCDPWWAFGGATLLFIAAAPAAVRLKVLFQRLDLSFAAALRLTLSSYFFNQVLPTSVGGDVYRTVRLRNGSGGWISTIGLLVLERSIGALTLILPALGYAIVQHGGARVARELREHLGGSRTIVAVLAGMAIAAAAAILFTRVRHRLRGLVLDLITTLRQLSLRSVSAVVVLSLLFHALRVLGMQAFLEAVGHSVPIGDLVVVLALTLLASFVPVSVGALGVREGILVYGLGACGVPPAEGLTVALLARLVVVLLGAMGGIVFYTDRTAAGTSVDESGTDV